MGSRCKLSQVSLKKEEEEKCAVQLAASKEALEEQLALQATASKKALEQQLALLENDSKKALERQLSLQATASKKAENEACELRVDASKQSSETLCADRLEANLSKEKEICQKELMNCTSATDSLINPDDFYTIRVISELMNKSTPLAKEAMVHPIEAQTAFDNLITTLKNQYSEVVEPTGAEIIVSGGEIWNDVCSFIGANYDANLEPIIEKVETKVGVSRALIGSKSNEFVEVVVPYTTTTLQEMDKLSILARAYISQGHTFVSKQSLKGFELVSSTLDDYPDVKTWLPKTQCEAFEVLFFAITLWSITLTAKKLLCLITCLIKNTLCCLYTIFLLYDLHFANSSLSTL